MKKFWIFRWIGFVILTFNTLFANTQVNIGSLEIIKNQDLFVYDVVEIGSDTFLTVVNSIPPFGTPDQYVNIVILFTPDSIIDSFSLDKYSSYIVKILQNSDKSGYLLAGSHTLSIDTMSQSVILLKFDNQFQPTDTSEFFPFVAFNGLYDITPHGDRFLICGTATGIPGYNFRSYVGIVNKNLEPDTIRGYPDNELLSLAYHIIPYKDKIIHTGFGYLSHIGLSAQIIVTDTLLSIDSIYRLPYHFGSNVSIINGGEDSTFFVSGRAQPRKISKPYGDLFVGKWHLRKGLIDTVIFGSYDSTNIEVVTGISRFGNYLYFGGTVNYEVPPEFGYRQSKYLVAKFDTNLNLIWQKSFAVENSYLYLNKILATSDGGVLLAGNKFDYVEHPNLPKRSVYIIKLDSNGVVATGLEQDTPKANDFSVYPNPTSGNIIIESSANEKVLFELFSSTGQMVFSRSFVGHAQLTVKHLSSGIYFYQVISKGRIPVSGKLVIQH